MQKYRIFDNAMPEGEGVVVFKGTLKAAQDQARLQPKDAWHDTRVELVVIDSDAASVENYLNGEQPQNPTVLKRWRLSPRGGLVELNEDGSDAATK